MSVIDIKNYFVITIMVIVTVLISGYSNGSNDSSDSTAPPAAIDYRQDMRSFVQSISSYAKGTTSNFIIIAQNGHELLTENGEEIGPLATYYISAIDGVGREDLFYGYDEDNEATPEFERDYMINFMDIAENKNIEVLTTDYCWTQSFVNDSYNQNDARGYISFAADHRELDNVPAYPATPHNVNAFDITALSKAKNFLYLLDADS